MAKVGPLSGQMLAAGKYHLNELLGSGGFGAVYKAWDSRLERSVAVKVMSLQGSISAADLQRFTRMFEDEAKRLASLKHPSIPGIYESFEEAGWWFLVMECIEGETLEQHLAQRGGRLPVEEALQIGLQLTTVLEYLHSRQPPIIFRDLKPANVMIAPDGQVYLIDFGIARLFTPGKNRDTFIALSRGYAAPEQHGTAQTTVRSDIYSLGATLHHLLSGTHPATTPFLFAPLYLQQSPQLASLILQMVAIDPDSRPPSMGAVKSALQRVIDERASLQKSALRSHVSSQPLPVRPSIPPARPSHRPTPETRLYGMSRLTDDEKSKITGLVGISMVLFIPAIPALIQCHKLLRRITDTNDRTLLIFYLIILYGILVGIIVCIFIALVLIR